MCFERNFLSKLGKLEISNISVNDFRAICRDGIRPFIRKGWHREIDDLNMYRIVIMDESAREIVHKVNYDEKIVNLKQFVGHRGGFSISLLWNINIVHMYLEHFSKYLTPPKAINTNIDAVRHYGGYPDVIFTNPEQITDFICPICHDVVRDAMETQCGHLLCKNCFITFSNKTN